MRAFLTALLRLVTNIFFRRIELVGVERMPPSGGVIFAANHPNGLVDPLFLICFAPRPVSFLAKAPLFRYPLIGFFARTFDSIPVYRKGDPGVDVSRNKETFDAARSVLTSGGAIAIFPEGTTHSDPMLKALKTGAARMALAAAAECPVTVVPTGIYYSAKKAFRSNVVMSFGEPIVVQGHALEADGEPRPDRVAALTKRIEAGLRDLTLQADSRSALSLVARAERIMRGGAAHDVAAELEVRRQFIEGYRFLCSRMPERLATLESHIARFEAELAESGLEPEDLERIAARRLQLHWTWPFIWLLLLPLAVAGTIVNYPLYRLIGFLSTKLSRGEEEVIASVKLIGGFVLYPVLWLILAAVAWRAFGVRWAAVALIALPLSAYAALRFGEELDRVIGRARAISGVLRHSPIALLARRESIRREIATVTEEIRRMTSDAAPTVWPPAGNDLL